MTPTLKKSPFPTRPENFTSLHKLTEFMGQSDLHGALDYLAKGGNCVKVAYVLAQMFDWYKCKYNTEQLKIEGYNRLREIVTNIIEGLWPIDADLGKRPSYRKVTTFLFTHHGLQAP